MNSEELEQSLRAEFENYLKGVVAEMRQGVSDFQEKIYADFEKHKEQLETSFRELNEQIGEEKELETSFTESVTEHLKLAKDEGARITATAIAEAEELRDEPEPPDFSELRDAINDISEKDSQSEILKALVNHATEYTSRGAFFIVKNEHLVGWRVFGREEHEDPQVIREVFFPVDSDTALSEAVKNLNTVSETKPDGEDDVMYRNKLGFEVSEQMYAIPLIARGRGVAVLYADTGSSGGPVNVSAIEAMMRVAGLTVEVLASAPPVTREQYVTETTPAPAVSDEQEVSEAPSAPETPYDYAEETAEFESDQEIAAPEEESTFVSPETEEGPAFVSQEEEPDAYPSKAFPSQEASEDISTEFAASEEEVAEASDKVEESEEYQFEPVASPEAEYESPVEESEVRYIEETDSGFETPASEFADTDVDSVGSEESTASFEAEEWEQPVSSPEDFADTYDSDFGESTDDAAPDFEAYDTQIEETFSESDAEEASSEAAFDDTPDATSFDESDVADSDFEFVSTRDATSFNEMEASDSDFEFDSGSDISADESDVLEEEPGLSFEKFEEAIKPPSEEVTSFDSFEEVPATPAVPEPETVSTEVKVPSVRPRFADRNLDLPIEVGEDERRLHNDARRFARLLVSEIKLYNEQKVKEGRESNDLYERLREAIDRSREMYDKRVQPPVAAKFDYFNYELVNTLAEGDEGKLGGSYPGPAI